MTQNKRKVKIYRRSKLRKFGDWFFSWLSKPPKYIIKFGDCQMRCNNLKEANEINKNLEGQIFKII